MSFDSIHHTLKITEHFSQALQGRHQQHVEQWNLVCCYWASAREKTAPSSDRDPS